MKYIKMEWYKLATSKYNYEPSTGVFTFKSNGKVCDVVEKSTGYKIVSSHFSKDGRCYKKNLRCHRLAFYMMTGDLPPQINHIDGDRKNNKWGNIEASNARHNARNRTVCSNPYGHGIYKRGDKFVAEIHNNGTTHYLGTHNSLEEAQSARATGELFFWGEKGFKSFDEVDLT